MMIDDGHTYVEEGRYIGQCYACERSGPVDDMGLCDDCAAKLDRDLIRQRAWDYAAMAFGVPPEQREALRDHVITHFGAAYELIVPEEEVNRRGSGRRRKRRHHRKN